jgi:hypothetical protein
MVLRLIQIAYALHSVTFSETLVGFLILVVMIVIVLAIFGIRERMAGRVVVPAIWAARIPALLARAEAIQ